MDKDLTVNDSASNAPEEILRLVKKFQKAHDCPMLLTREASGYHLYLPCPDCLHTHVQRELQDPKYSVNLSMLAGMGDAFRDNTKNGWMPADIEARDSLERRREYGSSICMRTRSSATPHRFSVEDLLRMATVTERHPDILTRASLSGAVGSAEREEMWEVDPESGERCPPPAGDMLPILSLPPEHPAVTYLVGRGFNPACIAKQFRLSFCTQAYPEGQKGIYYRKMPGGWKDSPRHRIIFHSMVGGIPMTWQGRLIEKVSDDGLNRFMLHPEAGGFYPTLDLAKALRSFQDGKYSGETQTVMDEERSGYWVFMWSHTDTRANAHSPWIPMPPFDEVRDGVMMFKPSKYRTAKYSSRQMMGWDAALERVSTDESDIKWVVLTEGPLDAARVGPGGVALIGSSISEENASKIASKFNVAFTGFDADTAGRDATTKVTRMLMGSKCRAPIISAVIPLPIPEGRDIGELSPAEYQRIFNTALKRSKRQS